MKLIYGTSSKSLGDRIGKELNIEAISIEHKVFPDGEQYVRLPVDVEGEDVVYVQTFRPDAAILEAFFTLDAIKENGASSTTLIVPYFGYARQDKVFMNGEAVSVRALMRSLSLLSDRLFVVDIHAPHVLEWYGGKSENIIPSRSIAKKLTELGVEFVLSPDKGALHRAEAVAKIMDVPFDHLDKTRLSGTEVQMAEKDLDVNGKTVAIVDDIISTGGTIARASEMLKKNGAKRVYAVCTHGLFIGPAIERLTKATDGFMSTDTIESEYSKISVAPDISEIIEYILQ
jgi:ribose-phosphate pyrophosphokinase